jgi:glycosyltransferase involved in cell wall biosynthesis
MRTKNRPLLLERALSSVASQTFSDYVLAVVNDGGDVEVVNELVNKYSPRLSDVVLIHNDASLGMEAASNIGINATTSEFIVIHDDDDSWHCDFLRETVKFLRSKHGERYSGVVTHVTKIVERLCEKTCDVIKRSSFNPGLMGVSLSDVAMDNRFPPISFLYRRNVCKRIGGYDESLPVMGDWDFNLRFLLEGDIGVIPQELANYHHRVKITADSAYNNTVVHGIDRHVEFDYLIRNKYLRQDIRHSNVGLGFLLSHGKDMEYLTRHRRNVATLVKSSLKNKWYGRMLWKLVFRK